ncbi:hypothetical protein Poli38472_003175 [Pythium oligandrum]|uniref:Activator of Hsp90 ATPase AHSA1-like N-terminal domain-containing protein n=1 Tax=Pythium oligandrum TaxID=41045 RepID=A0A8K1C6C1_PYTOL|nr:hypothetical protein Poli38472_003175 [Pythium oligandrum]|eukprot:TMW57250.1 hypothetical protein Poli38472_003175 [Pythium oligandrum]
MASDEEEPKKMHSGYHGWMKTIPKTGHDFTPVRIDPTAAATASQGEGSAWNAAGTWEERDKSEWARDRLKYHILTSFTFSNDALDVKITASAIDKCEGDAKVVFSRGKKRCGYDIFLKFEWLATHAAGDADEAETASGYVELHDFDDTSGEDYEVHVTVQGSSQHAKNAKRAVEQWETGLRKILATWKEELLQQ